MSTDANHLESLQRLAPELALLAAAFLALFSDSLFREKSSERAGWIALGGLVLAGALTILRARSEPATVFAMIEVDHFAAFFQLLMAAGSAVVVLLWMFGRREGRALSAEAAFLLLSAQLGGYLMVGTDHALLMTLGFVTMSLACCALTAFDKERPESHEAAMKLVVFGGVATALMIYGLSLLYGITHTLDFTRMGASDFTSESQGWSRQIASNSIPIAVALVLCLVGYAYKIALAPLQFWAPDVYEGSPSPLAAFFAMVVRIAGFGALLRFLSGLFVQDHVSVGLLRYASKFETLLAILAAVTMLLGSIAMLRQSGWKRLMAYSTIAHTGFAMVGVACLNETGFSAALLYLAISTLMNAGAFAAFMFLERMAGSERIDDMRGLGWKAPFVAVGTIVLLAGLTGLPPICGFYAKYRVFVEAWNVGFGWIALVGASSTLISAAAYFQVARALFFSTPAERPVIRSRVLATIGVGVALAILVLGIWTRPIEQWAMFALDLLRD